MEEGWGWRISGSSAISALEIRSSVWDLEFENRCQLSTQTIKGQRWGYFQGQICDFTQLSQAWKNVHEVPSVFKLLGTKSPQQIVLDVFLHDITDETLKSKPEEPIWTVVWSRRKELPRGQQQHLLARGLTELIHRIYQGASLLVLLLGSFVDGNQMEQEKKSSARYHVGLIMVHNKIGTIYYWKRLGFCIWQYEYSDYALESTALPQISLLKAEDHCVGWENLSGLFG